MSKLPYEYYTCHYTKETLHYEEFVLSKCGWLAIDGTRRNPISKKGKKINQSLVNGLRTVVNNKLISVANKDHPNYNVYLKHITDVRKENNYSNKWLRVDLTKEVYTRIYNELNVDLPNFSALRSRNSRKSTGSDLCLDYLQIPNNREHREVKIGKYFVDGVIGNIAIEFFGDYYHANPEIYKPKTKILGRTAQELWKKDKNRIKTIESHGYKVIVIWENDWEKFRQSIDTTIKATLSNNTIFISESKDLLSL